MQVYSIPVVTRLQDNGDGGWTMYVYNNEEEMLADHPRSEEWDPKEKKYVRKTLSEEEKNIILDEEDPYENGYIGQDTIDIQVDEEGKAELKGKLSFHAGQ